MPPIFSNPCHEIDTILSRICQDTLSAQKRLTGLDIISQQVSLVPAFINGCCDYLNDRRECLSDLKNFEGNISEEIVSVKRTCQLVARTISTCLRAALASRRKFETSFLSAHFNCAYSSSSVTAPCWISEQKPIGVSESILDMVINLADFARGFDNSQILESAYEIVSTYLEICQHRIEWMENFSRNESELDRLTIIFKEARYQLIEKLVEDGKFLEKGLELADKFQDFHWITALCDVLDEQCSNGESGHLDTYLQRYRDSELPEYVLDWYQERLQAGGPQGQLLAKIQRILSKIEKLEVNNASTKTEASSNSVVIGRFLERSEVQATRWLHEIETDEFGKAARTLTKLGELENDSLGRKKNLLSLAKLSYLADGGDTKETEYVDTQLKLIKFQEAVPPHIIEGELGYPPSSYSQPSIAVPQLVRLLLASARASPHSTAAAPIVRAMELIAFSRSRCSGSAELTERDFLALRSSIWSAAIAADDWADRSAAAAPSDTLLSRVMTLAAVSGVVTVGTAADLLPDVGALMEGEAHSADVAFAVRRAFEAIAAELGWHEAHCVDMDGVY